LRQRFKPFHAPGGEHQIVAAGRKFTREGGADAGGGAGNQAEWAGWWHKSGLLVVLPIFSTTAMVCLHCVASGMVDR
jgi:hypothetical protein